VEWIERTVVTVVTLARPSSQLNWMLRSSVSYRDLVVWQRAMDLVVDVYRCTRIFPREELFGLASQMRRSAVSVPSNIAEGKGRYSQKELTHFLFQARGSLLELQTQISIAERLGYLGKSDSTKLENNSAEVGRLLNGLVHRFLEPKSPAGERPLNAKPKT
jgi:four helix bundle protein